MRDNSAVSSSAIRIGKFDANTRLIAGAMVASGLYFSSTVIRSRPVICLSVATACAESVRLGRSSQILSFFSISCTGKTIAKTVKIKCAHSFGIEHRAQQLKQHAFAAVADTLQQEEYLTIGITGKNIAEHLPDTHLQSVIISGDKTYEIVKVRRTMAQSRQRYIQTMREK